MFTLAFNYITVQADCCAEVSLFHGSQSEDMKGPQGYKSDKPGRVVGGRFDNSPEAAAKGCSYYGYFGLNCEVAFFNPAEQCGEAKIVQGSEHNCR